VRDLAVLVVDVVATVVRLTRPGRPRAVVAESLLLKQQLLILNRFEEPVTMSVSNSCSGGNGKLDEVPGVRDPTHIVQISDGHGLLTAEGQGGVALQ
jgi:hypothetical protein